MKISELARSAFVEVRAHKTRSAMTSLSLSIGIAAMMFTFSQTAGMMKRYEDALRLAGPGRIEVTQKNNYVSKGLSPGLTYGDAVAIRRRFPELHMVSPTISSWGTRMRLDDFKNDGIATTANFLGGGAAFTTPGHEIADDSANVGISLLFAVAKNAAVSVHYDFEGSDGFQSHTGQLVAQFWF